MGGPAWNEDPPGSGPRIIANILALEPALQAVATARTLPSVDEARKWHRRVYAGVTLPVSYYAGEIRDSDPRFPALDGYEVRIGTSAGVASPNVPDELARFEAACQAVVARLDVAIPPGAQPSAGSELLAVLRLCAFAHGEWVRIHPFANCSGRTARIWANVLGLRYGLPAFVIIKPRPASLQYAAAAHASMAGDHQPTETLFIAMLLDALRSASAQSP